MPQPSSKESAEEIKIRIATAINAGQCHIFTDYDGTLAPFVIKPERAFPNATAKAAIEQLYTLTPITIHTGRSIEQFDALMHGIEHGPNDPAQPDSKITKKYNIIAQHGTTIRVDGEQKLIESIPQDEIEILQEMKARAKAFLETEQLPSLEQYGITLEDIFEEKSQSFITHWRILHEKNIPQHMVGEFISSVNTFLKKNLDQAPSVKIQEKTYPAYQILGGEKNFEFKSRRVNKGIALQKYFETYGQPELSIWLCDDLHGTDGDAAKIINQHGGIVIQVETPDSKFFPDQQEASPALRFSADIIEGKVVKPAQEKLGEFLMEVFELASNLRPTPRYIKV